MALDLPPMDDLQRAVMAELVHTVGTGEYDAMRPALQAAEQHRIWLSPPLVSVAAGLVRVLTAELDERPWQVSDDLWEAHLPDRRPSGRAAWRRANLTLHAAASLAGGVWLDIGQAESFLQWPVWPVALDVVELLATIAASGTSLSLAQLVDRLADELGIPAPVAPPA